MRKLIDGLEHFVHTEHAAEAQLYRSLAGAQSPETFFITCSDSRVVPNKFTQASPGELFVLRNAGNIVPPYGHNPDGQAATVEYAVAVLGVRHLVVCGHSDCGAMRGILNPASVAHLPAVASWLGLAERARRIVADSYADLPEEERLERAIEVNVLAQLDSLKTHPAVSVAAGKGELDLHGWIFDIASGRVRAYDSEVQEFVPLTVDTVRPPAP